MDTNRLGLAAGAEEMGAVDWAAAPKSPGVGAVAGFIAQTMHSPGRPVKFKAGANETLTGGPKKPLFTLHEPRIACPAIANALAH
jgi:hypothetical protein